LKWISLSQLDRDNFMAIPYYYDQKISTETSMKIQIFDRIKIWLFKIIWGIRDSEFY
jgi:hypothetical protein